MTSKEALEKIGNYPVGNFGIFTTYDNFKEEFDTIKQDLERLEELERIENETQDLIFAIEDKNKIIQDLKELIVKSGRENYKLKKALDIIKKIVSIPLEDDFAKVKIDKETKEETHYYALSIKYLIDEQEYELLKEVLENEK